MTMTPAFLNRFQSLCSNRNTNKRYTAYNFLTNLVMTSSQMPHMAN